MSCPRGNGQTYRDADKHGAWTACLACGWTRDDDAMELAEAERELARPHHRHLRRKGVRL